VSKMRIAIVSDVHGNLTALDAVLADLAEVRPDVVAHGGDLALGDEADGTRRCRWYRLASDVASNLRCLPPPRARRR
jgi:Icc-related predicted phosphoesterase